MPKRNKTNNNRKSRLGFRWFLYPSVMFYVLLYIFSNGASVNNSLNDILMSIVIGNFACTITAISVFAVFDYRDLEKEEKHRKAVLLTKENKIYFIDAILLALFNMIFSLVMGGNKNPALFFIVIISCYHTFMIFHYYLRERFNRNKKQSNEVEIANNEDKADDEKTNDNQMVEQPSDDKKIKDILMGFKNTILDAIILFSPPILFLVFDWKLQGNALALNVIFYALFVICILGCITYKELYLEGKLQIKKTKP